MFKKRAFYIFLILLPFILLLDSCATKEESKPYSIDEKVQSKNEEFEKCLDNKKEYRGKLTFTWEINSKGKPYDIDVSEDEVGDKDLITCFSKILKTIRFSTFGLYYKAKVKSYTFIFSDGESSSKSKKKKK